MAIVLLMFFCQTQVFADEIRPAYLEVSEKSPNLFSLLWKVPAKGDKKLSLDVILPNNCTNKSQPRRQLVNAAYIERWMSVCEGGLSEQTISIQGLGTTNTDVLLRLEFLDNTSQSVQLTPVNNSYTVSTTANPLQIVRTYTWLGITHILLGFDHILFVFALLLIVKSMRRLLWTITAFTLAHSITMVGATLGFMSMPQQPVEAMIALSILFLAMELAEIGLPQQAITLALIFFNIGVELGQLMFVAIVVLVGLALQHLKHPNLLQKVETVVVYAIGGLSSFWVFERISTF